MKTKLIVICALLLSAAPLRAAVDMFLKIAAIEGESAAVGHEKEIQILSYSFEMTNVPVIGTGGGASTGGRVSFQDIHFTKATDKATPLLMLHTANGRKEPEAVFTLTKSVGDRPVIFLKITFSDVLVTSYSSEGPQANDRPVENFSLNFSKVKVEYFPQNADGSVADPVVFSWNLATNSQD